MASIREKIATNAQPYLQPGEQVQGVFASQTKSQYLVAFFGLPFLILNRYRTVVATDRRILVLDAGRWTQTKAHSLVGEMPRSVKLGPTGGLWHKIAAGAETLHVHKRFFKDIAAIDAGSAPA